MKANITYEMTPIMLAQLTTKGYNMNCKRCGQPIQAGEKVRRILRIRKIHRSDCRYYHKKCYEEMLI